MTSQLEVLQGKNAQEMAVYLIKIIDSSQCDACPAKGNFCRKRPKLTCVEILENFLSSKVKKRKEKIRC